MPYVWCTNWIKPLYKGGDVNSVNNYRTIIVYSLMAKLFGCIIRVKDKYIHVLKNTIA